ncbi:DNA replication and repair protein RecF [Candidatus Peregrinibacteria bacterium]|nr:MAG: DNA replication and repair protein RecF [Candidatus Peregrinibacteria bacterium]
MAFTTFYEKSIEKMLTHLHLQHFRNHTSFSYDIPKKGMLIVGRNGSGKTSILEALSLLSLTKSFRSTNIAPIIEQEQEWMEIEGTTEKENLLYRWQIAPIRKTAFRRNDVLMGTSEILRKKNFLVTLFSPDDLLLPFVSPLMRRKYLNRFLSPLFPEHLSLLHRFEKILFSRNALLKRIGEGKASAEELGFYDEEFAKSSEEISKTREKLFTSLQKSLSKNYQTISGKQDNFQIIFHPSSRSETLQKLKKHQQKDICRGATSIGAHVDDFSFLLREQPLSEAGSRGEVRSALISLKMAEIEYAEEISSIRPILLLDDVFSELDEQRRGHLFEFIKKQQTIITATDIPQKEWEGIDFPVLEL